jgi:hypothetical protein
VIRHFEELGLSVEAALFLPPGTFSPYTHISSYLIIVRRSPLSKMFVAQISAERSINDNIIYNLKNEIESDKLELGRFVETISFSGIESLQIQERLEQKANLFGSPTVRLEDLAISINLGRHDQNFEFPQRENAFFIPLIGNSDVIDLYDDFTLKPQNYAQVVIDNTRSNSHFVTKFLNSELGKELRDLNKTGTVIRKLNKQSLKNILVFIPDFDTQKKMLEIEAKIVAEQNIITGLQAELTGYKRDIWSNPKSTQIVEQNLSTLSKRLSGRIKQHSDSGFIQWFDTLPYPLASILRAWQATPSHDHKGKYDLLQDFFEATAEFSGVIFLSAYKSNEGLLKIQEMKTNKPINSKKIARIKLNNISFGTWKDIIEYFGALTRDVLSGDKDNRALCADLFADPSLNLPERLSSPELLQILSITKKIRNDWKGHGGRVGNDKARVLNDRLIAELQKLREVFADLWNDIQLIKSLNCRPYPDVIENDISILMGSHPEFLPEVRSMASLLYVNKLYIMPKNGNKALQLHPLIHIGSAPKSANIACYFFNRLDDDGIRFVSYHHSNPSEYTLPLDRVEEIKKIFLK